MGYFDEDRNVYVIEAADRVAGARVPERYMGAEWENFSIPKKAEPMFEAIKGWQGATPDDTIAFIHGRAGSGKTHIAVATIKRWVMAGRKKPLFLVSGAFIQAIKDGFRDGSSRGEIDQAKDAGLLVLDDLGSEMATDFVQDTIYNIINHRYSWLKPTLITSNLSPGEIKDSYHSRLASRLASGLVLNLSALPDRRILK